MRIKTGRRQNLKSYASENDLDYMLVKQYQKLKSRFADVTLKFQKKYGGVRSEERLRDIRDISLQNIPYNERQFYLEYLVESAAEKVRHGFEFLRSRQDNFLTNILDILENSDQYTDQVETGVLREFLTSGTATTEEKADLISSLTGRGIQVFQYNEDGELIFNASHVMKSIQETLMNTESNTNANSTESTYTNKKGKKVSVKYV